MLYDFVSLIQIFISIVISIHLMTLCKKKKTNEIVSNNVNSTPAPIPTESKTESFSASSPKVIPVTVPTPANVPGSPNIAKQASSKISKNVAPEEKKVDVREKEKKPERSLNSAFNERLKEDQSAGVSETV